MPTLYRLKREETYGMSRDGNPVTPPFTAEYAAHHSALQEITAYKNKFGIQSTEREAILEGIQEVKRFVNSSEGSLKGSMNQILDKLAGNLAPIARQVKEDTSKSISDRFDVLKAELNEFEALITRYWFTPPDEEWTPPARANQPTPGAPGGPS